MSGEFTIPAPRERVWQALNDPEMIQKCLPGCESVEIVGEDEMHARMTAKVGPVKAKFSTKIFISNVDPPTSYTLSGEGQGGVAGFAKGAANVSLAEADGGTVLSYDADVHVGGKLAQIGSRLVAGSARKIVDQFFGNFVEHVR